MVLGLVFDYICYFSGLFICFRLIVFLLRVAYRNFLAQSVNVAKMGEWALVTGSTDGIGKAYAEAMAKKGLNVVLVSRTPFKLQNVAADIESKYKVKTKIIDVDFTGDSSAYSSRIAEEIKDLEIGVLINNVGMSYEYPEEYLEIEDGEEFIRRIVACNVMSVSALVRVILPQMVQRKKGVVINVSSLTAMFNMPLLSAYGATKSYVDKLTQGLEYEYGRKGITIQCVMPGYVVSKMSKMRRANWMVPTPETFVKSALSRLGIQSRTTGYWAHELMAFVMGSVPEWINTQLTYSQLSDIRKRALKKKAN